MRYSTLRKVWLLGFLSALPLSAFAGTEVYVPLESANAIIVVDAEILSEGHEMGVVNR